MQAIPSKAQSLRFDWIFSPWQDLLFFFLPIPFAICVYFIAQNFSATNALLLAIITQEILGLGSFHQGATIFHFVDKTNRNHYMSGKNGVLLFIVAPLCLFLATVIGEIYLTAFTFFIYICWSLNHAVQQNIGLLLLYQNGKSNEAKIPRDIQAWSQRWMALCFALLFFKRIMLAGTPLYDLFWVPIAICGAMGIAYCVAYFVKLASELRSGKYMNVPVFAFWVVCVSYLVPFGFLGKDYDTALMIPLIVHWCQYIGINYVVVKRKYEGEAHSESLPMKRPLMLYAIVGFTLVFLVATMHGIQIAVEKNEMMSNLFRGSILGLGMVHYYLDGFIWRFRDKFPREAMLPYLVRR